MVPGIADLPLIPTSLIRQRRWQSSSEILCTIYFTYFIENTMHYLINLYFYSKLATQKKTFNSKHLIISSDSCTLRTISNESLVELGCQLWISLWSGIISRLSDYEDRTDHTEEERRGIHIPAYVSNSEGNLIISSHLFLSSRLLDSSIVHCSSNTHFKAKGTWFFEYMNQFSFKSACATPYFKKETYWLVNPEYVSIVWQRFIRTKVSNRLGLHPGALFPFEHAGVSSGEGVQNGSLRKERELS